MSIPRATAQDPNPMAWLGLFFHLSVRALCLVYSKKCQGIVEDARAVLTHARSYTQKTFFGPPSEALVTPFSIQKPSQKHQKLTSIG
jgi:hypothetical protein